jgi:hypothetical protein
VALFYTIITGLHFVQSADDENMVCSPISVAGVMHMLAAGSDGETRMQVKLGSFSKLAHPTKVHFLWNHWTGCLGKKQQVLVATNLLGRTLRKQLKSGIVFEKND